MSGQGLKKKLSGAENRKRKAEKEKDFNQIKKKCMTMDSYVETKSSNKNDLVSNQDISPLIVNSSNSTSVLNLVTESEKNIPLRLDFSDVGCWPNTLLAEDIEQIIIIGPNQIHQNNFPKDESGRHFANLHYSRRLPNNELVLRRWLVYSPSKNQVFCFCCRLFDKQSNSNLVSQGYNDWKHLSESLKGHENSALHKKFYQDWFERETRLKIGKTIDCEEQKLISRETLRWKNVLTRLMNIVLFLAENNMAFRGNSDKLYTPNNGKFLGLVQLLGKFDPIMEEHLKLAMAGNISDHYCGKDIQNELINLMGDQVKSEIISRAKQAKYYSIIADCTPDKGHIEQLSLTIRFADISQSDVCPKEHFLEFLPVNDSTGAGLTEIILNALIKYGLELNNCRGQSYDNGANMKGKNSGVQKRILELNHLAFFVPCGCHSYNLVLCDAARSSVKSVTLFGTLQRLFTLFSASVNRWKILTDHLKLYTLKKLSDTRWEAKISSVKAVRYQIGDVYDALITLANETEKTDATISHEAVTLADQLTDFSFIISLVIWYDILFQINIVSKSLQSENIDLRNASEMLQNCCNFLEEYRKNGFKKALVEAKELAEELQVDPIFKPMRRLKRVKRMAGEKAVDELIESPEKKFEIEFFNVLLDTCLVSIKERFNQLHDYSETWSFLYNIKKIPERDQLKLLCANLQQKLTLGSNSDIEGNALCAELISLKTFFQDDFVPPIQVLNFIKHRNIQDLYPNIWITYRILITIPVTVASGERSFSKLKLIKTYLRSTMSQSRLTNLATLSIENEIANILDFDELIRIFASKKARKINFC